MTIDDSFAMDVEKIFQTDTMDPAITLITVMRKERSKANIYVDAWIEFAICTCNLIACCKGGRICRREKFSPTPFKLT